MNIRIIPCTLLFIAACPAAEKEARANVEEKATGEAVAKTSSVSQSSSSSTTSIDGKTVNIHRKTGPDGEEIVTVTTIVKNRKPKVEQMTAEEFLQKYSDRKSKKKAKEAEAKAEPQPAPTEKPGKATE